jgi:phosphoribosylformimino-5-aminoimidazole carboxamide ribotide isomerase
MDLMPFLADYLNEGAQYVICTDISKDGMLAGPSFDLYEKILNKYDLNLIASGGISDYNELGRLAEMGCEGTIIGKAIYENRITLKQLEQYILNN